MIDSLAPLTLRRRGVPFTAYWSLFVHSNVFEDQPRMDATLRRVARDLVWQARTWDPPISVDPGTVIALALTHDDLVETAEWMVDQQAVLVDADGGEHRADGEAPHVPSNIAAVIAYVTVPEEPTGETATAPMESLAEVLAEDPPPPGGMAGLLNEADRRSGRAGGEG